MQHIIAGLGLLAASAVIAGEAPVQEAWFRILSPEGETIGIQHEALRTDAAGQVLDFQRTLDFRTDGHEPVRQVSAWATRSVDPANGDSLLALEPLPGDADAGQGEALQWRRWPDGDRRWLLAGYRGAVPVRVWQIETGEDGRIIRARQPLPGSAMIYERSPRPLREDDISRDASMPHQQIDIDYAISPHARQGHIRYLLALPAQLAFSWPVSGEQRVQPTGTPGEVQVDLCEGCGPGLPDTAADLARWRQPGDWLQSDAAELVRAAAPVARARTSDTQKMRRLMRLARARLRTVDYAGQYSALDAWRRRRGDCTEDAALLAALARAAGIPAVVASGLVHSRERYHGVQDAFMPHSWVIAYADGAWHSFDLSGDFDATRLALTIGEGEPWEFAAANQIAGLVEWRSLAEVRRR